MRKLITKIVGLSLFVGSVLFAQDSITFQSFYPELKNDTPNYLTDNRRSKASPILTTFSQESDKHNTLTLKPNNLYAQSSI